MASVWLRWSICLWHPTKLCPEAAARAGGREAAAPAAAGAALHHEAQLPGGSHIMLCDI